MLRSLLFALYGLAVGFAYAALLHSVIENRIVSATASLIVVALVTLYGWQIGIHPGIKKNLSAVAVIPLVCLAAAFVVTIFLLIYVVCWPFLAALAMWSKWQFRREMRAQGRFATFKDLRPRLQAGVGTLIEETGHKGPYCVWWTSDDLFSLGKPVSTDEELIGLISGRLRHEFNDRCIKEYLDEDTGKALLTTIPARHIQSGKLALEFPQAKVVRVVRSLNAPAGRNASDKNGDSAE